MTMRTDFADCDLTFYVQVFRDFHRAHWCLAHLRRHYPAARVLVVSDGDLDLRFATFVGKFGVELHYGERLYPLPYGGRLLERMLSLWGMRTDYLFKVDPDAQVRRRFRCLPKDDLAVFGDCEPTQGGCMGITRAAGEGMLESRLLRDLVLTRPAESWARRADGSVIESLLESVSQDGLVRTDWIMAWCCRQLGIPQIGFPEVYSRWREDIPNGLDVAVTHPHKEIPIDRDEL